MTPSIHALILSSHKSLSAPGILYTLHYQDIVPYEQAREIGQETNAM